MSTYDVFDKAVQDFDSYFRDHLALPNPLHRAAIFGNGGEESGGFKTMHQKGGHGRGGWQWDDRRAAFEAFCAAHGVSPDSVEGGVWYVVHEGQTTEKHAIEQLRKTNTLSAATYTFMKLFERPGVEAESVRLRWAGRAYTIITGLPQEKHMPDTNLPVPTQHDDLAQWIVDNRAGADAVIKSLLVAKGVPGPLIDVVFGVLHQIDLQTAFGLVQHVNLGGIAGDLKAKGVQLPSFSSLLSKLHIGG